jgi:hypothetical protein
LSFHAVKAAALSPAMNSACNAAHYQGLRSAAG